MPPCPPHQATLTRLLDHLSLVASFHDFNRMNSQNIAVCFGPVLLTQSQEPRRGGTAAAVPRSYARSEDIASAVDFKRHIEVLHYLLQAWPGEQEGRGAPVTPILGHRGSVMLCDVPVLPRSPLPPSSGCRDLGALGVWVPFGSPPPPPFLRVPL